MIWLWLYILVSLLAVGVGVFFFVRHVLHNVRQLGGWAVCLAPIKQRSFWLTGVKEIGVGLSVLGAIMVWFILGVLILVSIEQQRSANAWGPSGVPANTNVAPADRLPTPAFYPLNNERKERAAPRSVHDRR